MDPLYSAPGLVSDAPPGGFWPPVAGTIAATELFDFALGIALVAGLFWCLYHLESDWPVRLVRDPGFRHDAAAILFAIVLAFFLSNFLL